MDPIDEPRYERERVIEREPVTGPAVPPAGLRIMLSPRRRPELP